MNKENTGNSNSGSRNTGDWNSGDWNSGKSNSGSRNTGKCNSGDWNSGNLNSGSCNTGYKNTGNWNCGYSNSGYSNSGDCNSGYWNSGYWNSGNLNSGYLNTNEPKVRVFNKQTNLTNAEFLEKIPNFFYFDLTSWVASEEMTKEEKEENPSYEITNGYLKTKGYKEAWREAWNRASQEEKEMCLELPNWNNEIFKEITGIDVEKELSKENQETIEIKGKKCLKSDIKSRLKNIKPINY